MSKIAGKSSRFWLNHRDMSGNLNAVDMDITQELPPVNCFGDEGPRVVDGNYGHKHALRGFYVGSSSAIDAVASTLMNTTGIYYLASLFAGTVQSSPVYESIVQGAGTPIKAAVAGAVIQEIALEGSGAISRGQIIYNGTLTSTAASTANDETAGSTNGTYQAVFRAFSGTFTNCVLQVQDGSNGTTWGNSTDLTATFTASGSVARATSTAALLRYKRVICSAFTGTDAAVAVTGGIVTGSLVPTT